MFINKILKHFLSSKKPLEKKILKEDLNKSSQALKQSGQDKVKTLSENKALLEIKDTELKDTELNPLKQSEELKPVEQESLDEISQSADLKQVHSLESLAKDLEIDDPALKLPDDKILYPPLKISVTEVLGKEGLIAPFFENYAPREGQIKMAAFCKEGLKNSRPLVIEAGTGTGKTLAYLLAALINGGKIVVATATKALQDQIALKELPLLLKVLGLEERPFLRLKGFSNYLCLRNLGRQIAWGKKLYGADFLDKELDKIFDLIGDSIVSPLKAGAQEPKVILDKETLKALCCMVIVDLKALEDELLPQEQGLGELSASFDSQVLRIVGATSGHCQGGECPFFSHCFAYKVRALASQVQVLVINHALLCVELFSGTSVILDKKISCLIVDEAHSLVQSIRNCLEKQVSKKEVLELLNQVIGALERNDDAKASVEKFKQYRGSLEDNFTSLNEYLESQIKEDEVNLLNLKYSSELNLNSGFLSANQTLRLPLVNIWSMLQSLILQIDKESFLSDKEKMRFSGRFTEFCDTIVNAMNTDICPEGIPAPYIFPWGLNLKNVATINRRNDNPTIRLLPVEVGEIFANALDYVLEQGSSAIFTSATISVQGKFTRFLKDLGQEHKGARCFKVESPFDYEKQAKILISRDFPDPKLEISKRISELITKLEPLITNLKGGMFFLTTSKMALEEASKLLREKYAEKRLILVQGEGSTQDLIERFKVAQNAILVGTSTFWEGVDVKGPALSMVIIDKLPFPNNKDPLFKARCDALLGRGDPFFELSIPEAVIKLRQGVGRLIRDVDDKGVAIIADPRLVLCRYGRRFTDSLLPIKASEDYMEIVNFLESIGQYHKP